MSLPTVAILTIKTISSHPINSNDYVKYNVKLSLMNVYNNLRIKNNYTRLINISLIKTISEKFSSVFFVFKNNTFNNVINNNVTGFLQLESGGSVIFKSIFSSSGGAIKDFDGYFNITLAFQDLPNYQKYLSKGYSGYPVFMNMYMRYGETKDLFVLGYLDISMIITDIIFDDINVLNLVNKKFENITGFISFMIGSKFDFTEVKKIMGNGTVQINFEIGLSDTSIIFEPELGYYFRIGLIYAVLTVTVIGLLYYVIKRKGRY